MKKRGDKKGQTHVLKLSLIIIGFVVAFIVIYNVVKPFVGKESEEESIQKSELATIKPTSSCKGNQNCNDNNDCTQDICKNKFCEYTNKTDSTSCSLGKNDGVCKNGKCISR